MKFMKPDRIFLGGQDDLLFGFYSLKSLLDIPEIIDGKNMMIPELQQVIGTALFLEELFQRRRIGNT